MPFRPSVNSKILLPTGEYRFTEHPAAKGMPYGQTGRRATVYQVQDGTGFHALKVFTSAFRTAHTATSAQRIAAFAGLPGLQVCSRLVLTRQNAASLLGQHPDLEYAVLMPWVKGETWQEIMLSRQPLTSQQSLTLAQNLASILSTMEQNGIAHCDLSGPNVLISGVNVALVDVEDLYAPGLEQPAKLPGGSAGYGHKTAVGGLWRADADRFAGAVLLAEMLGWSDERVRRIAVGEQFFSSGELQENCDRYQLLSQSLRERWGEAVASLFNRAWHSQILLDCPTFQEWIVSLSILQPSLVNSPVLQPNLPTFKPNYVPLPSTTGSGIPNNSVKTSEHVYPASKRLPKQKPIPRSFWVIGGLFGVLVVGLGILSVVLGVNLSFSNQRAERYRSDYETARNSVNTLSTQVAELEILTNAQKAKTTEMESQIANLEQGIQALMPDPKAKIIFGPENGQMKHDDDDYIEAYYADVTQANFIARVLFTNPYGTTDNSWDYGFLFRDSDKKLVVRISSDEMWFFDYIDKDGWHNVSSGSTSNLNKKDSEKNEIILIAKNKTGYLYINNFLAAILNLTAIQTPGSIAVATGMSTGAEVMGKTTAFSGFTIWSLP